MLNIFLLLAFPDTPTSQIHFFFRSSPSSTLVLHRLHASSLPPSPPHSIFTLWNLSCWLSSFLPFTVVVLSCLSRAVYL
jgi:hypothetical protein